MMEKRTAGMELNEFLDLKDYTLSIDWSSIENDIGFQLHNDLKRLYSRAYAKYVRGEIKFEDKDFLVPTDNKTFYEYHTTQDIRKILKDYFAS